MQQEISYEEGQSIYSRPERIVLVTSVAGMRAPNIITVGWETRTSFNPPMLAISIGKSRYSHQLIAEGREFVVAIPGVDIAEEVYFCGTRSGRKVHKFAKTGLTPLKAKHVRPPLIEQGILNFECKVVGSLDTGDHTIFVGEVVATHKNDIEKKMLISIGEEMGYGVVFHKSPYRMGFVKEEEVSQE